MTDDTVMMTDNDADIPGIGPWICSICRKEFTGDDFSHNAWPVNDGDCCTECDSLVLRARLNEAQRILRKQK